MNSKKMIGVVVMLFALACGVMALMGQDGAWANLVIRPMLLLAGLAFGIVGYVVFDEGERR